MLMIAKRLAKCHTKTVPFINHQFVPSWLRSTSTVASQTTGLGGGLKLRAYQEDCILSILDHLQRGHKRLGVSLATGSGKTVIFTHLIDRIIAKDQNSDQSLILVHRRELVEQAVRHCVSTYPTKTVEVEMGDVHASGVADITVASLKSLTSKDRLQKFDPSRFKLVLVDETHHIVAPGYLKILDHFGLLNTSETSPALVGVSATLSRFDGVKLGAALDHIVYHRDYMDMIAENWLSDIIFTTVRFNVDLSEIKTTGSGDFSPASLSGVVNTKENNDLVVQTWNSRAGDRKSTIVFCIDVAHVRGLTEAFRRHGIEAVYVTGADKASSRDEKLDGFKDGKYPVLLNCGVFTEGTDIPNIDCVLLARPTRSRNLLVQMIGRGMRLHREKKNCHVIDMVSALKTGIVTVPTLFGLDPSEIVKEASINDMKEIKVRKESEESKSSRKVTSVAFTDYDSVNDLIEDTDGERHIRALSRLAWVHVDEDKYILQDWDEGHLTIERGRGDGSSGAFQVRSTRKVVDDAIWSDTWRPYQRTRVIATSDTFEGAVHAADTFAQENFGLPQMCNFYARWRKSPASAGQVNFLNKFRDLNDQIQSDEMSKGRATDMITKIKFGARGRLKRIKGESNRIEKRENRREQTKEMMKREQVQVGPLDG